MQNLAGIFSLKKAICEMYRQAPKIICHSVIKTKKPQQIFCYYKILKSKKTLELS